MLLALVFVVSLMVFLILTVVFPILPPGQIIFEILGNSHSEYIVVGIPAEVLLSGLINGLIWGVIIILVYSYFKGPEKGKVDLPTWVPGYTKSNNSKIGNNSPKYHEITQDIETINGIGHKYGLKLRKIGIKTLDDLLQVGHTRTGRNYLAKKVGVSNSTILNWVYQAEINS